MLQPIAIAATLACLFAAPDVVPRGLRGVKVETAVDFAALADRVVVQRAIVAGDTIEGIVAKEFGDVKRVADVLALNPDVDPRRLRIGQTIWLPAKKPGDDGALVVYVAAKGVGPRRLDTAPAPYVSGRLPDSITSGYRFVLVPEKHREAYEKSIAAAAPTPLASDVAKQIVEIRGDCHGRYVAEGSTVQRIVSTVTFTCDEHGKLGTTTKNVCYDKDGKEVVEADPLPGRGNGNGAGKGEHAPMPGKGEALLLLGMLGGGVLVLRSRRALPAPRAV